MLMVPVMLMALDTAVAGGRVYVTDKAELIMRTGQGIQYKIIRVLTSGTALEVLEENAESGYSQVRTTSGTEGWVLSRYLQTEPIAEQRLADAEKELAQLKAERDELRSTKKTVGGENTKLTRDLNQANDENQRLTKELERIKRTSSDVLAVDEENQSLKENVRRLEGELQLLQQENSVLKDHTARDWFMVGAGVVLLGMIIGLIIPKISWRKKSSWGSL